MIAGFVVHHRPFGVDEVRTAALPTPSDMAGLVFLFLLIKHRWVAPRTFEPCLKSGKVIRVSSVWPLCFRDRQN